MFVMMIVFSANNLLSIVILLFFLKSQAIAGSERHLATVVCSRSSTKAVVITDVQERTTIDHGVLLQAITIGIENGATVLVSFIVTKYGILFTLELNLAR